MPSRTVLLRTTGAGEGHGDPGLTREHGQLGPVCFFIISPVVCTTEINKNSIGICEGAIFRQI